MPPAARRLVDGVDQYRRHVEQARDHLHLALARLQPALGEALLRGHAADVVVEEEASGEEG